MTLKNLKIPNSFLRNTQILDNQNLSYNNEIDKRVRLKLKKLPDDSALKPNYKGSIFIGFFKVKLKDIVKVFVNPEKKWDSVRGKNSNIRVPEHKDVIKISNSISSNPTTWNTKFFEPPIISEYGELLMGAHRYDAYNLAGETWIIVAVVRFIQFENKTALYWLRCAQGKENNQPIIKKEGTDENTIKIVLTGIEEKTIKNTREDIETSLKDQGINNGPKRKSLIKEILQKTKKKLKVEIPLNYNKEDKKKYFKENYPNSKLSTLSVYKLLDKPKNININDDTHIHFLGTYKDQQDRYPIVNPFNLMAISCQNPHSQVYFNYSIDADNVQQVKKMRKFVPKNFKEFENMILKMADHIRSKNYKRPIQIHLPQLKEDKK